MLQKRILAYLIDCALIVMPLMVFSFIIIFFGEFIDQSVLKRPFYIFYLLSILFCYLGLLGKDLIGKRSIGKRIMKLTIISEDGSQPKYLQLIIRNLFMLVWPIEALMLFGNKNRIGDKLAKTKVVIYDKF